MGQHIGERQFCDLSRRAAHRLFGFLESFRVGKLHENQRRGAYPSEQCGNTGDWTHHRPARWCVISPRKGNQWQPSGRYVPGSGGRRCRGRGWICRGHTIGIIAKPSPNCQQKLTCNIRPPKLTPPRMRCLVVSIHHNHILSALAKEAPCNTFTSAAPVLRVSRLCLGTMNFGPTSGRQLSDHGPPSTSASIFR